MKDDLEKYISENKSLFDDQLPGDHVWTNIKNTLHEESIQKKEDVRNDVIHLRISRTLMQYAAIATLVVVSSLLAYQLGQKNSAYHTPIAELDEAQNFYKGRAEAIMVKYPNLVEDNVELRQDIDELETAYNEIRQEFIERGGENDRAIMEQMLQIYKMKIEILENAIQSTNKNIKGNEVIEM